MRNKDKTTFIVTTYINNGGITEKIMTEEEFQKLDPNEVDFHWNEAAGQIVIHDQNGNPIKYSGSIPGVGKVNQILLTEMMWQPGKLITPRQLCANTKRKSFSTNNNISSHLTRLRTAFGEKKLLPWYFRVRKHPFAFGWNADRSWRIIEVVAENSDGKEE